MWLKTRAIDSHRANSRLLKKALRMVEKDDISTVVYVNAAKITDNYWIRPIGSDLVYSDIRLDSDFFLTLHSKVTMTALTVLLTASIPAHRNLLIPVALKNAGNSATVSGGCIKKRITAKSFQNCLYTNLVFCLV